MSSKSKSPSIEIPTYQKPDVSSFDIFGTKGIYDQFTNTFSVSNPEELATMQAIRKTRSDLLKSLGITEQPTTEELMAKYGVGTQAKSLDDLIKIYGLAGAGGTGLEDPYTKTLLNESLRLTQPSMENALIGRGLGGSSVYGNALTDLYSKLGTQAILGGQQYKLNDLAALLNAQQSGQAINLNNLSAYLNTRQAGQQYNLNDLAALNDYLNNQYTQGYNLLSLLNQRDIAQQGLAQELYRATLPYYARVTTPSKSGWPRAIAGAIQGFATGGQEGAIAGGATGYYSSAQPSQTYPYLLYNQEGTTTPTSTTQTQMPSSQLTYTDLLRLAGVFGPNYSGNMFQG